MLVCWSVSLGDRTASPNSTHAATPCAIFPEIHVIFVNFPCNSILPIVTLFILLMLSVSVFFSSFTTSSPHKSWACVMSQYNWWVGLTQTQHYI